MFEPKNRPRTWGFRFFASDAVVIAIMAGAAIALRQAKEPLWWILVIVGGHFFLFCNIIRIRRSFEIAWAALFITNISVWTWFENLSCAGVLSIQLPITAVLVIAEIRSARYHGAFASRANPRLNDYLEGKIL